MTLFTKPMESVRLRVKYNEYLIMRKNLYEQK